MTFHETLSRLEIVTGFKPEAGSDGNYKCLCPVHADNFPSLSVKESNTGDFAIFYCFAGCNWIDIKKALDDGFCFSPWNEDKAKRYKDMPDRKVVAKYVYQDEVGNPLFQKLRFEPKSFALQHWSGNWWKGGMNGIKPVLYRLPEVIAAHTVFIHEGEKAVEAMRKWGLTATCSFNGASKSKQHAKWLPDSYNIFLKGKHVVLIPDNDDPGRSHCQFIASTLKNIKSLKILRLPVAPKGDFYDWWEVGNTIKNLRLLWEKTPIYKNL